ncbi:hypothetical protein AM571_PA00318 (plasmid) [Rhizobium etli 8C-3]|uniref:Uncharacterized protein n=1 Tax=Rhizobium etli 8C-3 TaxID=538025 RepID=A0A1L5PAJ1_RHIET|nr:hypothetical protein AM571_PA00318 [Rhizobium etli 8C-3]
MEHGLIPRRTITAALRLYAEIHLHPTANRLSVTDASGRVIFSAHANCALAYPNLFKF